MLNNPGVQLVLILVYTQNYFPEELFFCSVWILVIHVASTYEYSTMDCFGHNNLRFPI